MHCLKHCTLLTDVGARRDAQAADEARAEVAHDVAVQVLCEHHIKARWVLHHAHACGVDDHLVVADVWIVRVMHFTRTANEQTVRQLHDVCFVKHRDALATAFARIAKRIVRDIARRTLSRDLDACHHALRDFVFDARVQTFGVLANDHEVDILVSRLHAIK